jgi:glycosyltransferase involved in cell wall biosynthesis
MRIAIITNLIAPYRTPIYERLAALPDCELHVVYESASEPGRQWDVSGTLPFSHTVLRSLTLDLRRLAPEAFLHLPWRPNAALRRFRPDVVLGNGGGIWSSPANIAALTPRRRWAFVPSWEGFDNPRPSRARRLAEPWVRTFMRAGDAWLAWGSRAARDVVRLGADPERTIVCPQVSLPTGEPTARSGTPSSPAFLYVGRLVEHKGVRVLLKAFADAPGELWIAGDGPLRGEVEAFAADDSRVTYHGHLEQSALAELYRRASALVLPSSYEVWGLVVNEALAHGLPAIVSDQVGAGVDLVEEDVTGYTVPVGSASALAEAMRKTAAWREPEYETCRLRAQELLEGYTFEQAAARVFEACRVAVEHRRAATGSG